MLLNYKNQKYTLSAERNADFFNALINGKNSGMNITKLDSNEYIISDVHGHSETVFAAKDDKHIYVMADNFQYVFDILPDNERFANSENTNDGKHENIKSPMPGSIVKVLVEHGDSVNDGEPVIIIEAMKMETKLYASISGTVKSVNCKAGEQIDSDFILMEIVRE